MTYIPDSIRDKVRERADSRCEYCKVHQDDRLFSHEIDHIYAEKHQGATELENLCLACSECNRFKGSDLCSLDIDTGTVVQLYHPRADKWDKHFQLNRISGFIKPIISTGRVTVRLLRYNKLILSSSTASIVLSDARAICLAFS